MICRKRDGSRKRRSAARWAAAERSLRARRAQDWPGGFTLIELVVTLILLGMLLTTVATLLGQVGRGQRDIDQRQIALYEADSLLEELVSLPWENLTGETAAALRLSDECRAALRDPQLMVTIAAVDDTGTDTPEARRISVELRWTDRFSNEPPPVRLSAWRHDVPATAEGQSDP